MLRASLSLMLILCVCVDSVLTRDCSFPLQTISADSCCVYVYVFVCLITTCDGGTRRTHPLWPTKTKQVDAEVPVRACILYAVSFYCFLWVCEEFVSQTPVWLCACEPWQRKTWRCVLPSFVVYIYLVSVRVIHVPFCPLFFVCSC